MIPLFLNLIDNIHFIYFIKRKVLKNSVLIVGILIILLTFRLQAQDKIFEFNFDDCTYEDATVSFPGITPSGSPGCICGVTGQSIDLNGSNDILVISNQANMHFEKDFTLEFYFWLDAPTQEVSIFSHRNGCTSLDSLMSLRYFAGSNDMLFELASSVNNYHSARAKLDYE